MAIYPLTIAKQRDWHQWALCEHRAWAGYSMWRFDVDDIDVPPLTVRNVYAYLTRVGPKRPKVIAEAFDIDPVVKGALLASVLRHECFYKVPGKSRNTGAYAANPLIQPPQDYGEDNA